MRWDHTRSRKASRADRRTERSRSPRTAAVGQTGPKTGPMRRARPRERSQQGPPPCPLRSAEPTRDSAHRPAPPPKVVYARLYGLDRIGAFGPVGPQARGTGFVCSSTARSPLRRTQDAPEKLITPDQRTALGPMPCRAASPGRRVVKDRPRALLRYHPGTRFQVLRGDDGHGRRCRCNVSRRSSKDRLVRS
jgi:hypothetical protein